ncbi:SusC/RagA family TonB-linked outer membrane protein [Pedobacter sp. UBA4863]|uniref:SusC/RagA family TonB-linked outer membrane protein n=1 Tax=Pedobacter sp. UBA4863 TaxID=1947060 RepID=UPI0025D05429|nr:SusC/RagA family TonB-linked outer membrane protein [Pedobacter sp. UBA4863]
MVKNYRKRYPYCHKLMRLSLLTLFLLVLVLSALATGLASAQDITLDMKQSPVRAIFSAIEKQAGVSFTYNEQTISKLPPIDIQTQRKPLTEVLAELERRLPIKFRQIGKTIAVSSNQANKTPSNELSLLPITGTVKDENDKPIPAATIRVKGRENYTITDNNGNFTIEAQLNEVLLISYIGFTVLEYRITNENPVSIKLSPDTSTLQEVSIVSTGYQDIPKERATGSFSMIENEQFNRQISTDVISRLKAIAPSVQFDERQGDEQKFSIRGRSTIMANTQPLIVLDNFPFDGNINNINPHDIESITLLKDAAAASIWGVRAGNGVLVIKTKSGRKNQLLNIDVSTNLTIKDKPDIFYDRAFLTSSEYINVEQMLFDKGFYNSDLNNTTTRPIISPVVEILARKRSGTLSAEEAERQLNEFRLIDIRNDQSKYFYRNGVNQQYAVNFQGGADKTTFHYSAGYDKNTGNIIGNGYDRVTLNANQNFDLSSTLRIGTRLMVTNSNTATVPDFSSAAISGTKSIYPYARLATDAGSPLAVPNQYRQSYLESLSNTPLLDWLYRPLQEQLISDTRSKQLYLRLSPEIRYIILPGLSAEVKYQYERTSGNSRSNQSEDSFATRDLINKFTQIFGSTVTRPIPIGGVLNLSNTDQFSHTIRAQLGYDKSLGRLHELTGIVGYEIKQFKQETRSVRHYGYNDELETLNPLINYNQVYPYFVSGSGSIPSSGSLSSIIDRYISYFSNGAYTFNKKYTFSVSARIDQSNLFGVRANQKQVPLWSAGAAWNISSESFFKVPLISYLKLRTTFGYNGNIDKSVTALTTGRYQTDSYTGARYVSITNPGNPELRWERNSLLNIGIDFGIFNNRISGSIEYYQKKGIDLIGNSIVDPTLGIFNNMSDPVIKGNYSNMRAEGLDLQFSTVNFHGRFKWNSNILLSYNRDEVTRYNVLSTASDYLNFGNGLDPLIVSPLVGNPVQAIYSYRWAGLDPLTGDPRGYDANGNISKTYTALTNITPDRLIYNGTAMPTFFGSFMNTFGWKSFSLSFNVSYKFGYYFKRSSISYPSLFNNWSGHVDYLNRWQNPGDELSTSIPSIAPLPIVAARQTFYQNSEVLINKGDHIRLNDIRLGYELKLNNKKSLKGIQLFIYSNNLGIIWRANKYGLDPDLSVSTLPLPKTITFGLSTKL